MRVHLCTRVHEETSSQPQVSLLGSQPPCYETGVPSEAGQPPSLKDSAISMSPALGHKHKLPHPASLCAFWGPTQILMLERILLTETGWGLARGSGWDLRTCSGGARPS